jgi:hypothetical protein
MLTTLAGRKNNTFKHAQQGKNLPHTIIPTITIAISFLLQHPSNSVLLVRP